jgi:hypothetical protein
MFLSMGNLSGYLNGCLRAALQVVSGAAFVVALALLIVPCRAASAQDVTELALEASVSGGNTPGAVRPLRVIFVVDGSNSMREEEKESPTASTGIRRWDLVARSLRSDVRALTAAGVPAEITTVRFSDAPCDVAKGVGVVWRGTLASEADAEQVSADIISGLGSPSGGTKLFLSVQNAVAALDQDLRSGRYSGGQIIVYSDGADSTWSPFGGDRKALQEQTVAAVRELRQRYPMSNVVLRTFGNDARAVAKELPDLIDLTGAALRVAPKVSNVSFRPAVSQMEPLRSARVQRITVRSQGLDESLAQGVGVQFVMVDAGGQPSGQPIRAEYRNGAWSAEIALPASERGLDVRVLAEAPGIAPTAAVVRAPALALPPNVRDWGLPKCGSEWGTSCVVATPVPLSVRVPDHQVRWFSDDGSWSAQGASVSHPGFAKAGEYRVGIEVRTEDGAKKEWLTVRAIDPTLEIVQERPSANVGDEVSYRVSPLSGAIASGARASDVRWFIDGQQVGSGGSLKTRFQQRGKALVSAEVSVDVCGVQQRATGSCLTAVVPVPSVELIKAELVSGAGGANSIPVRVMVASRVAAVELKFNGAAPVRTPIAQVSSTDDATIMVEVPAQFTSAPGTVSVAATPEVRGDNGKVDSAASSAGRREDKYEVRKPDPRIIFDEPVTGFVAAYESQVPIKLHLEGSPADLGAVSKVHLEYSDGRSADIAVGKDAKGAASVTPRFASGTAKLGISATAIGSDGKPLGKVEKCSVDLRQPKLQMVASVDQVHRTSKSPADLVFRIECSENSGHWDESIESTDWTVMPEGIAVAASQDKTKLVLQVNGIGELQVKATVRRAGGSEVLGPVRVPVVIDPVKPNFRVTELNSASQVGTVIGERMIRIHDRTDGPVASRSFEIRRDGGEWMPVSSPDSFTFAAATQRGELVEVRGTFTSIDGTVVIGDVQEFRASPDHNWALVAVAALVSIGLLVAAGALCLNNEFLGARGSWSGDESGNYGRQDFTVRWLRGGNRCSLVSKRATLELPNIYGENEDDFRWLDELRNKGVRIEMGGNLPKPRLTGGGGVGIEGSGRGGRVRRTALMPTDPLGQCVYLETSPSPNTAFISWVSLTAVATAVVSGFTFLFLGGYI